MAATHQASIPALSTLFYVSRSLVDKEAVLALVARSRENNQRQGLTGGLLFTGKYFAQALEGPISVLEEKMRVISRDPRHTDFTPIALEALYKRTYGRWGMGYINDPSADSMISQLIDKSIDVEAAAQLRALLLEWISDDAD